MAEFELPQDDPKALSGLITDVNSGTSSSVESLVLNTMMKPRNTNAGDIGDRKRQPREAWTSEQCAKINTVTKEWGYSVACAASILEQTN